MLTILLIAAGTLTASFLCSLLEAALLSLTPAQIEARSARSPAVAKALGDLKRRIDRPLSVILIVNTAMRALGAAMVGAEAAKKFGESGAVASALLFSYLTIQLTELLPKGLGVRFNHLLAPALAAILPPLIQLCRPVTAFCQLVNKPFAPSGGGEIKSSLTASDLAAMTGQALESKAITAHQERIIRGAIALQSLTVGQIMIPREDITFLHAGKSLIDNFLMAHHDPHTRFPVCGDDGSDHVLGYVNFKEMVFFLNTNPNARGLRDIVRPVSFCPPGTPAGDLLSLFIQNHEHMAIVRSDEGRVLGLVTMEDIVEQIVGDIEDEYDRLPKKLHPIPGGIWMVGGGVPMDQLGEAMGFRPPNASGTVASWVAAQLDHAPMLNEKFAVGEYKFYVRRVRRGQVFEVAITASGDDSKLEMLMPGKPRPAADTRPG